MPLSIVVALVILLGVELGMRAAAPHLPDVLEWRDWQTQNKVEAMDALAARGGASIVALGTSQMNTALDPALLARLTGSRRPAFNAALNGSSIRTFEPWMLDVVLHRLRPDVVVIGVNVAEMNDSNLVAADSHRRFVNGLGYVRASRKGTLLERIEARLGGLSHLVRERTLLREPSKLWRADPAQKRAAVSPLGEPNSIHIYDDVDYFLNPAWVERIKGQVLQGYHTGGPELAAFTRLVDALRARNIDVIVVRMPMTQDAYGLHPQGSRGFELVGAMLRSFAVQAGAGYLDFMPRFPTNDGFFDPGHLTEKGRDRFTEALAFELAELHVLDQA